MQDVESHRGAVIALLDKGIMAPMGCHKTLREISFLFERQKALQEVESPTISFSFERQKALQDVESPTISFLLERQRVIARP